jgi:hypothetical protein
MYKHSFDTPSPDEVVIEKRKQGFEKKKPEVNIAPKKNEPKPTTNVQSKSNLEQDMDGLGLETTKPQKAPKSYLLDDPIHSRLDSIKEEIETKR